MHKSMLLIREELDLLIDESDSDEFKINTSANFLTAIGTIFTGLELGVIVVGITFLYLGILLIVLAIFVSIIY